MNRLLTAAYKATNWFFILLLILVPGRSISQNCNNWLHLPSFQSYVSVGDLDIPGNKITVEATFMRTAPYSNGQLWAGDLVSKHVHPTDVNYLLRPNNAEITTTTGYHRTPDICEIELNKVYHAAMVYDGTTLKFYRNGYLMSSVPATGNLYQNNFDTRIGLYDEIAHNTNLIGYINEVRIWNVARTQQQIRTYMNTSLPNPTTQPGLKAYYTFNNLLNKQGDATWNGTLGGSASINNTIPNCTFVADSCKLKPVGSVIPSFEVPDTVCVNNPVNIVNTTVGASSYYWDFCVGGVNKVPQGVNLGNPGNKLAMPVFMDYVYENGNYYGFLTNYNPGKLIRLDFGNSLLNTPTTVDLGNVGNVMPLLVEGIQVVKNEGKWYAIIVAGYEGNGLSPRVVKISFGTNITNTNPVATNWGNIGNLQQPIDLHVFQENGNWYGFTVNAENNTLTRFNFTNSFENTPTAVNLGNVGNLAYPTGIYAINDNNFWRVFVVNGGNNSRTNGTWSLTRLDFGNSLLNTPTGVNLGNSGNFLKHPRDLTIMKFCGETVGFAVNGAMGASDIVKMEFKNGLNAPPTMSSLGNIGNLNFPHSIARLFRVGSSLYSFITNVGNNTMTRLEFKGCTDASIPNSTLQNPPSITYSNPGTYNINLTVDDGLPTQAAICKQVVVLPEPVHHAPKQITVCDNKPVKIGVYTKEGKHVWNNGTTTDSLVVNSSGTYWVETDRYGCINRDSFEVDFQAPLDVNLGDDIVICPGSAITLDTKIFGDGVLWNTGEVTQTISVNAAGTYIATVSQNGCEYKDTVNVTLRPVVPFAVGSSKAICLNDSVQLNASGGDLYTWTGGAGLSNYSNQNPKASPEVTTQYFVTITDTVCNRSETLSTVVEIFPLPNVQATKSSDIDCRNAEVQLSVNLPGNTVIWSPAATLNSSTIPDPVASPASTTSYIVKVTDLKGCIAYDTIEVKVFPKPNISVTGNTLICKNESVQLSVSGGQSYEWFPGETLDNPLSANPVASPDSTTMYWVKITDNISCEYLDSVAVSIRPDPQFAVIEETKICKGGSSELNASGGDTYQWSPATGLSDPGISNPMASPLQTTTYVVTITDNTCNYTNSFTSTVVVLPDPVIIAGKSNDIDCSQDKAMLTASGADQYEWYPVAGLSNPNISNPIATPLVSTEYIVKGTSGEGCVGFDTVTVKVTDLNRSGYLVPNAFTPNNDGLNDCYKVKYWGQLNEFEFAVFNRWGERLFFSKNPAACWDGTYKGQPQDSGVYIYIIKASSTCQPEIFRKGTFTLIR